MRRDKAGNGWHVADSKRYYFGHNFLSGVLTEVRFVQKARPMKCEAGYDSTGEAIGKWLNDGNMPRDAKLKREVVYDRSRCRFHIKDRPQEIVRNAHFLVLMPDGRAIAGWKK